MSGELNVELTFILSKPLYYLLPVGQPVRSYPLSHIIYKCIMKPLISWNDFEKLDIRAGTVLSAMEFPEARKPAYRLTIDFGPLGIRHSSAQITGHYSIADLPGRQVLAVVNFPPKNIAGFISECLVLGIYTTDDKVVLLEPGKPVQNGGIVG